MHPIKGVCVDLNAKLMRNGGQVHNRVGGTGNGRMDHDGVLEALLCHDILCTDAPFYKNHQLNACVIGRSLQLWRSGRHQ